MATKKLMIVESPNKIHKLQEILGSAWDIVSTSGHIEDFPKNTIGINIKDFSLKFEFKPEYENVIRRLNAAIRNADEIFIATDPDREGEAIAHSVSKLLKGKDYKRITFDAITDKAVKTAINNPRKIYPSLVDAAHSRKAIDRLIGYVLSPLATDALNERGTKEKIFYAVGRVLSPSLALVDGNTDMFSSFRQKEYHEINAVYDVYGSVGAASIWMKARAKNAFPRADIASAARSIMGSGVHTVKGVKRNKRKVHPPKPLVTSTALMGSYVKHGFPADKTMQALQKCFSSGTLTYHRTDSPRMSPDAIDWLMEHIKREYGEYYFTQRDFISSELFSQEAHECIRPAQDLNKPNWMYGDWAKIFEMARDTAIASLMADAIVEDVEYTIDAGNGQELTAQGQNLVFDGFYKVLGEPDFDHIPNLQPGTRLSRYDLKQRKAFTPPPDVFNDASIIGAMVDNGLGRPGTRARIIEDLRTREYIEDAQSFISRNVNPKTMAPEQKKLYDKIQGFVSSEKGKKLVSWIDNNHGWVNDKNFTAEMEDMLDDVAKGKVDPKEPIQKVWEKLKETVPALKDFEPQTPVVPMGDF